MGFTKLDSGIVDSSIWSEPNATRVVWITMLAKSDQNGYVACSYPGLLRASNVTKEEFEIAIEALESPDKYSRTQDFEGRRIEKIEGGWLILNHEKYRLHNDLQREKTKERVKKYRELKKECNALQPLRNVTVTLPSVSVSVSASASESVSTPSSLVLSSFEEFWKAYPKKVGKGNAIKSWGKIKAPKEILELIKNALAWQTKTEQWAKDNGQYIPMPSTYLNGQRWLDESTEKGYQRETPQIKDSIGLTPMQMRERGML